MKYNTFLFDFDYTLVDSSTGIVQCFRTVLDNHGYTTPSDEDIKRTIGKTLEESFSVLTGEIDAEILHTYRQEYVAKADEIMTANTFLFPETKKVLTSLKENGARLGIISTKYKYRIKEFLDLNFPENFFDIIIGIEEVDKYKPHPEGILKAIKILMSKKKDVIYIGDSTMDAEAAQRAEVDFIGVTHGVTTTLELAQYMNVAIVPDLSPLLSLVLNKGITKLLHTNKRDTLKRYFNYRKHIGATKSIDPYKHCVCKNCGTYFTGEYCNNCGQRRNTRRFTLRYIFKNILGGLTNIDDGFLRTIVELLYRPGYMIYDYIKGKRSHYFKPFQTLFILAAIYIILVQISDPLAFIEKEKDATFHTLKNDITAISTKSDGAKAKAYLSKSMNYVDSAYSALPPDEIEKSDYNNLGIEVNHDDNGYISSFIDSMIKIFNPSTSINKDNPTFVEGLFSIICNWIKSNKVISLIIFIPLYAFATKRAFRKNRLIKDFNYTELLFAQVYIASQMVLISILMLPILGHGNINDTLGISWWLIFLLYWWDYKQLFQESWKKTFKRTIMMFIYLFIIMLMAIIAIAILVALWTAIFI